jgi:elongation factor P
VSISTNDLKNGMTLDLSEGLFQVVEFQHVKPGKGGAFVRTTLKNVRNGAVIDRTFRAGEKLEQAIIDKREMNYLYRDGDDLVFMDNQTYDQLTVPPTALGSSASYIVDGSSVLLMMYGDEIVGSELPASVELTVTDTEPGMKSATVTNVLKPATVETGAIIQVPAFVTVGDVIRVDTESGEYLSRAK